MNTCGSITPAGLSECNARLKKAVAMLISVKGTKYTAAELATLAKTKTYVALAAGINAIYVPLSDYKDTTDAPEITKGAMGTKSVYDDAIPSGTAFVDRAFEDYKALWNANNSVVEVEFITKDGYRLMTPVGNGTFKGFRAEIYSEIGIPKTDTPAEAHPVHVFFKDLTEFANMEAIPMLFSKNDIEDVLPIGLNMRATSAYGVSAKTITVKASKRGSETGKAGLTTWVAIGSNVTTPGIVATDSGLGAYSLVITKNTSDALAAGEYVDIQAHLLASTYATYITNVVRVYGV